MKFRFLYYPESITAKLNPETFSSVPMEANLLNTGATVQFHLIDVSAEPKHFSFCVESHVRIFATMKGHVQTSPRENTKGEAPLSGTSRYGNEQPRLTTSSQNSIPEGAMHAPMKHIQPSGS